MRHQTPKNRGFTGQKLSDPSNPLQPLQVFRRVGLSHVDLTKSGQGPFLVVLDGGVGRDSRLIVRRAVNRGAAATEKKRRWARRDAAPARSNRQLLFQASLSCTVHYVVCAEYSEGCQ